MKKKRLIMTAALLSAFCMSAAGCSLYPGNKETQPANASQAETETKDETKQQPTGETEEETEKPTDAHPEDIEPFPHGEKETKAEPMKNGKRIVLMTDIHYLADSLTDKGEEFQYMVEHGDGKLTNYVWEITHEVGSLDAVADVAGVCLLVHMLGVERIVASPVHVGSGQVRCAHGILPVPAPATAHILRDVPIYGGAIRGELCTPTGAALLKHFVTEFGSMPVMKVEKIGYGMGNKEFEAANCVRALLGETAGGRDEVAELCCNLDDMTAEAIGFAQEELLAAGALDVYTTPIGMKKGRPAVLLSCMCRMEDRERLLGLLFRHTTTLGVRENVCRRYTLERGERTVDTPHGPVRLKTASGWGVVRSKPEYEDVARIARGQGISLAEVCDWLK